MAGPIARVGATNDPWAGGGRARASGPTDVRPTSFAEPGAGSFPAPTVGGGALMARQNRGSNVQIPYARIAPMHSAMRLKIDSGWSVNEFSATKDREEYEYDGLEAGELAWIMGKVMSDKLPPVQALGGWARKSGTSVSYGGKGVDRLQRMASTDWVFAYVRDYLKDATIDLFDKTVFQGNYPDNECALAFFESEARELLKLNWWNDASLVDAGEDQVARKFKSDTSRRHSSSSNKPNEVRQGFSLMERSPFFKTIGFNRDLVLIEYDDADGNKCTREVPRHLGSWLAQHALVCQMKKIGLFDWVPDGVCLSKLATGPDAIADAASDAREGQVFNIGVQGPCITKTWSRGDPAMQVLPGDKLFILVQATVSQCKCSTAEKFETLFQSLERYVDDERTPYELKKEYADFGRSFISERFGEKQDEYRRKLMKLFSRLVQNGIFTKSNEVFDFYSVLGLFGSDVLEGSPESISAYVSDFRLVRATSSWLSNCSALGQHKDSGKERCGLNGPIGIAKFEDESLVALTEYFVGGWCIGTVLDAAASRALGHNGIRVAPSSMAYNANVNVEWWTADALFDAFSDREVLLMDKNDKVEIGQELRSRNVPPPSELIRSKDVGLVSSRGKVISEADAANQLGTVVLKRINEVHMPLSQLVEKAMGLKLDLDMIKAGLIKLGYDEESVLGALRPSTGPGMALGAVEK